MSKMPRKRPEMKVDAKGQELNQQALNFYERCCRELKLNPKRIHDIEKAPSYHLYYNKCREFLNYIHS
jgi:hypothetical protein